MISLLWFRGGGSRRGRLIWPQRGEDGRARGGGEAMRMEWESEGGS